MRELHDDADDKPDLPPRSITGSLPRLPSPVPGKAHDIAAGEEGLPLGIGHEDQHIGGSRDDLVAVDRPAGHDDRGFRAAIDHDFVRVRIGSGLVVGSRDTHMEAEAAFEYHHGFIRRVVVGRHDDLFRHLVTPERGIGRASRRGQSLVRKARERAAGHECIGFGVVDKVVRSWQFSDSFRCDYADFTGNFR